MMYLFNSPLHSFSPEKTITIGVHKIEFMVLFSVQKCFFVNLIPILNKQQHVEYLLLQNKLPAIGKKAAFKNILHHSKTINPTCMDVQRNIYLSK